MSNDTHIVDALCIVAAHGRKHVVDLSRRQIRMLAAARKLIEERAHRVEEDEHE